MACGASRTRCARIGRTRHSKRQSYRPAHAKPARAVVAVYACFHIGAVAVPLNNRLEAADLKPLLERLRPALYIGDANLYSKIDAIDGSMFTHDCSGKVLSDDEIVDVHMRTYELSDKISVRPCFENHNNMWSEQSGRVKKVAEKVRARGGTTRLHDR
jgi:acyl-coenzyme A synthetase/AMP-(fatty) acid ligase